MPLVKLGYLLIRTIAKPFSGIIKNYAKDHQKFKIMCIQVAQTYHTSEVKLRRGLLPRKISNEDKAEIKPLDSTKAIETGANFIGESIVFVIASILLIADQLSSRAKENTRRMAIEDRFQELEKENQLLKSQISSQQSRLSDFEIKFSK